ncbi:hypothetical protein AN685_0215915 [Enterobacter roggenkampii]|nr:hypothetical protein AN685_0215915 [Enterobacter roggenkampii]
MIYAYHCSQGHIDLLVMSSVGSHYFYSHLTHYFNRIFNHIFDQGFHCGIKVYVCFGCMNRYNQTVFREGANKQVISSQADSLIKISRIWADFFPANTSNQPI